MSARPPVATACRVAADSSLMRLTNPSTMPTYPRTIPTASAPTVVRPQTCAGFRTSMRVQAPARRGWKASGKSRHRRDRWRAAEILAFPADRVERGGRSEISNDDHGRPAAGELLSLPRRKTRVDDAIRADFGGVSRYRIGMLVFTPALTMTAVTRRSIASTILRYLPVQRRLRRSRESSPRTSTRSNLAVREEGPSTSSLQLFGVARAASAAPALNEVCLRANSRERFRVGPTSMARSIRTAYTKDH